jgi:hypothetical protein
MPRSRIRVESGLFSDDVRMKQVRFCQMLEVPFLTIGEREDTHKRFVNQSLEDMFACFTCGANQEHT